MAMDLSKIKRYELDLARGIAKADGPEDHQRMMDALALLKSVPKQNPNPILENANGLRLLEVLDKMFLLKQGHKQATVLSYKNTIKEFSDFLTNPHICSVMVSDVTRYQEFLAGKKKNTSRTIDNKVATLRSLFNFAIQQGYFQEKNPAEQSESPRVLWRL